LVGVPGFEPGTSTVWR